MMAMLWMLLDMKEMFAEELIVETIVAFEYFLAEVNGKKRLDLGSEVTDFMFEEGLMKFAFLGVFLIVLFEHWKEVENQYSKDVNFSIMSL
jgi:hypothetical protein